MLHGCEAITKPCCAGLVAVADRESAALAVGDNVVDLVVAEPYVDGRDAHAELRGGEVQLEVFCAVVGHYREPIAGRKPECDQRPGATIDAAIEFVVRVAVIFVHDGRSVAE